MYFFEGDFDVPSSREEVDRDSLWNQWLRSEIAGVFVEALEVFKVSIQSLTISLVAYDRWGAERWERIEIKQK